MNDPRLVGRTIVEVRPMTDDEMRCEGWYMPAFGPHPTVLVLDDGRRLYAGSDEEGNDPGTLRLLDGDDNLALLD